MHRCSEKAHLRKPPRLVHPNIWLAFLLDFLQQHYIDIIPTLGFYLLPRLFLTVLFRTENCINLLYLWEKWVCFLTKDEGEDVLSISERNTILGQL